MYRNRRNGYAALATARKSFDRAQRALAEAREAEAVARAERERLEALRAEQFRALEGETGDWLDAILTVDEGLGDACMAAVKAHEAAVKALQDADNDAYWAEADLHLAADAIAHIQQLRHAYPGAY